MTKATLLMAGFKCEGCGERCNWPADAQPFHLQEKGVCHDCNRPYVEKPCRKKGSIHPIMYKGRCDWQICSFCGTNVYGHNAHTLDRCAKYLRDELAKARGDLDYFRKSDDKRFNEVVALRDRIDETVRLLRSPLQKEVNTEESG